MKFFISLLLYYFLAQIPNNGIAGQEQPIPASYGMFSLEKEDRRQLPHRQGILYGLSIFRNYRIVIQADDKRMLFGCLFSAPNLCQVKAEKHQKILKVQVADRRPKRLECKAITVNSLIDNGFQNTPFWCGWFSAIKPGFDSL